MKAKNEMNQRREAISDKGMHVYMQGAIALPRQPGML
jgi:hypothetical protein